MKRKLFLLLCALLTMIGVQNVKAYTTTDLTNDGWTKITSITQSDITRNYYIFLSENEDLILKLSPSATQSSNAAFYETLANPAEDCKRVWYLEANGDDYAMRNIDYTYLQMQTEWSANSNDLRWRTNDQRASISWTGLGLTYANGVWSLTSTQYDRPLGIYNNETGTPVNGKEIGANDTDKGQKFNIYAISRSGFAALLSAGATSENPRNLTSLIFNPDFNNTTKTKDYGWTVSSKSGGNYNFNGAVEAYHYGNFDIHQTLSVPNGKYRVTVQALKSTTAYLYVGEGLTKSTANVTETGGGTNFAAVHTSIDADPELGKVSVDFIVTNGQITFGLADPNNGSQWLVFDNFKLYSLGEATIDDLQPIFSNLQTQASNTLADNTYDNVTGSERTNLQELSVAAAAGTVDGLNEQISDIRAAINEFISSKSSYDSFDVEKASAMDMGVAEGDIVRPTSASNLQDALHALYVQEDVASKAGYTVDATGIFGTWTPQNIVDTQTGQHWDGTTTTPYYDHWQNSGYTSSVTNNVTLPAGKYVFKAAARASTGVNGAFNMSVKIGESDATYKHYQAKGDSGKGIDKSGAANYGAGEFANNNNGRGWEWRFISFELDEETSVRMQIYAQMLANNWVGFSDITLLTTEDNIEICRQIYVGRKDVAEDLYEEIMNADVLQALKDAVVDEATLTTADEFKAATSALNTAIDNANTSISNYIDAKAVIDAASSLDAAGKASYAANEDVIALKGEYDDKTLVSVSSAQRTACEEALRTAAKAQTTENADMTLAIVNWDFLNCQHNNFPGWTIEAVAGSNTWENGDTKVEYWKQKAVDGGFDYYQTVTGLPNGKYTLSASMWNTTNNQTETPAPTGVDGQAGVYGASGDYNVFAGVTDDCDANNLHTYTTGQITVANGTLRLGVKNKETMGGRWFGVDWIKLTFVRALTPAEEAEEQYKEALDAAQTAKTAVGTNYGGVFQHTTATYDALADAIETYDDVTGDADAYTEAKNALNTALTNFNNSVNLPDENKTYVMFLANNGASTGYNLNLSDGANRNMTVSSTLYRVKFEASSTNYIIEDLDGNFIATASGNNSAWGTYKTGYQANSHLWSYTINNDGTVTFNNQNSSYKSWGWKLGSFGITAGSKVSPYDSTKPTDQRQPNYNDWIIKEAISANMAVNAEAQWGTFCAPFEVAIPDGVDAYTCADATKGVLNLEKVTTTIPANTPVILNAEEGLASTTFYGVKVPNESDDLIAGGLLRGNVSNSAKDIDYTGNEYLLQRKNDKTGFYKMNNENTYKVGYNRCYLVMDSNQGGNAREVFFFEDDATAISALEAAKAETGALKDGKYLIGNKVVIVKNGVKYGASGQKLN